MRGKEGVRKNNARLCQLGIQTRFLYTEICEILRKLRIEKLKVKWGIRAIKYKEKIRGKGENNWLKKCWRKKKYGKERGI